MIYFKVLSLFHPGKRNPKASPSRKKGRPDVQKQIKDMRQGAQLYFSGRHNTGFDRWYNTADNLPEPKPTRPRIWKPEWWTMDSNTMSVTQDEVEKSYTRFNTFLTLVENEPITLIKIKTQLKINRELSQNKNHLKEKFTSYKFEACSYLECNGKEGFEKIAYPLISRLKSVIGAIQTTSTSSLRDPLLTFLLKELKTLNTLVGVVKEPSLPPQEFSPPPAKKARRSLNPQLNEAFMSQRYSQVHVGLPPTIEQPTTLQPLNAAVYNYFDKPPTIGNHRAYSPGADSVSSTASSKRRCIQVDVTQFWTTLVNLPTQYNSMLLPDIFQTFFPTLDIRAEKNPENIQSIVNGVVLEWRTSSDAATVAIENLNLFLNYESSQKLSVPKRAVIDSVLAHMKQLQKE